MTANQNKSMKDYEGMAVENGIPLNVFKRRVYRGVDPHLAAIFRYIPPGADLDEKVIDTSVALIEAGANLDDIAIAVRVPRQSLTKFLRKSRPKIIEDYLRKERNAKRREKMREKKERSDDEEAIYFGDKEVRELKKVSIDDIEFEMDAPFFGYIGKRRFKKMNTAVKKIGYEHKEGAWGGILGC